MAERLNRWGIRTAGELARCGKEFFRRGRFAVTLERTAMELRGIPATEAAGILKQTDRAQMMPDWQSILILGIPAVIAGLIVMTVTEKIIKRRYRLPSVTDTETENGKNTGKEEGKNEA